MFNFVHKNVDFSHQLDVASKPTENYYKHLHYFNEILYFIKGDVLYNVEGEVRKLQEGDIVVIPSGMYHFAMVNSSSTYERYVLKFTNDVLPEFLADKIKEMGPFFPNQKKYSVVFDEFDTYFGKYSDDELHTLFLSETVRMLVLLCHAQTHALNQSTGIIDRLVKHIDENIREPITLDSLAENFNFSKSYISNEFRKAMKIPIMQYVRAKKIIAAHRLILNGEKKRVVAEMFSFDDYSTFYRSYVKVMGFSPTDIKKQSIKLS